MNLYCVLQDLCSFPLREMDQSGISNMGRWVEEKSKGKGQAESEKRGTISIAILQKARKWKAPAECIRISIVYNKIK